MGVLTQPKSFGTRFLPHVRGAIRALRYNWCLYVQRFSERKAQDADKILAAKAANWLDKLLDFGFIAKYSVYEDIITHVSATANVFQAEDAQSIADASRPFKANESRARNSHTAAWEVESKLWLQVDKGTQADIPHIRASTRSNSSQVENEALKLKLTVKQRKEGKFIDTESAEPVIMKMGSSSTKETVASVRISGIEHFKDALAE